MLSLCLGVVLQLSPTTSSTALVLGQKVEVIRSSKKAAKPGKPVPVVDEAAAAQQAKKDQELTERAAKLDERQKQLDAKAEVLKAQDAEREEKKAAEAKEEEAKKKAVEKAAHQTRQQWNGAVDALGD